MQNIRSYKSVAAMIQEKGMHSQLFAYMDRNGNGWLVRVKIDQNYAKKISVGFARLTKEDSRDSTIATALETAYKGAESLPSSSVKTSEIKPSEILERWPTVEAQSPYEALGQKFLREVITLQAKVEQLVTDYAEDTGETDLNIFTFRLQKALNVDPACRYVRVESLTAKDKAVLNYPSVIFRHKRHPKFVWILYFDTKEDGRFVLKVKKEISSPSSTVPSKLTLSAF